MKIRNLLENRRFLMMGVYLLALNWRMTSQREM